MVFHFDTQTVVNKLTLVNHVGESIPLIIKGNLCKVAGGTTIKGQDYVWRLAVYRKSDRRELNMMQRVDCLFTFTNAQSLILSSKRKKGSCTRVDMKKCPCCSCEFETEADFEAHMKAFGSNEEEHVFRFRKYRQLEHGNSESEA